MEIYNNKCAALIVHQCPLRIYNLRADTDSVYIYLLNIESIAMCLMENVKLVCV